jgi:hypothetical protein
MPIETRGKIWLSMSLQTLGPKRVYEVHCDSEFNLPDFLLLYNWSFSMCLKSIVEWSWWELRTKCLSENHEGRNHFGNQGMSWKVRLNGYSKEREYGGVNWIQLVQDKVQRFAISKVIPFLCYSRICFNHLRDDRFSRSPRTVWLAAYVSHITLGSQKIVSWVPFSEWEILRYEGTRFLPNVLHNGPSVTGWKS